MKTLWIKRDYQAATQDLEGQFPDSSHVGKIIQEDNTLLSSNGTVFAILLINAIPAALHKLAYELWKTVSELPDNRATAVGALSLPRIKADGTLSGRHAVPREALRVLKEQGTAHGVIGYLDATADQPCHKTPLTVRQPELVEGNERLVMLVDKLYRRYSPETYAKQRAEVDEAPHCRLWDTVFSTIYLAKNLRTAYHRDSGNLPGVFTALMPMGKFTGGELVLPRWRIAFAFKPGDLLLFDPQQLHGNLPFEGQRLSAAFYCEQRIADCGKQR